jgi:hypothetical protein
MPFNTKNADALHKDAVTEGEKPTQNIVEIGTFRVTVDDFKSWKEGRGSQGNLQILTYP